MIEPTRLEAAIDVAEVLYSVALQKRVAAIKAAAAAAKAEAEAAEAEAEAEAAKRYAFDVAQQV